MALDSPVGPEAYTPSPAPQSATGRSTYPVDVTYERPAQNKRFWAVPLLGILVKSIILIPHMIVLSILEILIIIAYCILWVPVLLGGKYPEWGYALMGGTLRWSTRVTAYLYGLTDEYPPFTFRSANEEGHRYTVQVAIEVQPRNSRWWAFPLLGVTVKLIILIPHLIALSLLGSLVTLVLLGLWIPVLFGGRYPDAGYQLCGGTLRWSVRVSAYFFGLTDRYPPFSFN